MFWNEIKYSYKSSGVQGTLYDFGDFYVCWFYLECPIIVECEVWTRDGSGSGDMMSVSQGIFRTPRVGINI